MNDSHPPAAGPSSRIERLQRLLGEEERDALLVTKLENIAYLTGFSGSAAMLLIDGTGAMLTTDGRYTHQAEEELSARGIAAELVIGDGTRQFAALAGRLVRTKILGLEERAVTWSLAQRCEREFYPSLVPSSGLIERLRSTKDAAEIAVISRACGIADEALAAIRDRLSEGVVERDFAAELDFTMRRLGAAGPSFTTIVASGPRSALPHARPSERRIVEGDLVVVDFGALVDGYHSDMTRTFIIGEPTREQERHYEAVRLAQEAGVAAVAPGVAARAVDLACREVLVTFGLDAYFTHGTGHGVGLEIHEAPSVGSASADSLSEGMVVTVEPGVYLPGLGGVRIEDMVQVTETGVKVLTSLPRELESLKSL